MPDQRPVTMTNIPAVPLRLERDLYDFLSAVKAGIRLRHGGFPNAVEERFITYREYSTDIAALEARIAALESP